MRSILRYLLTILIGALAGAASAVHTVRAGALGSTVSIGPWQTGRDFGTAEAGARTRAVVALRGLLALPAKEARYYTAATDDAGRPLEGRCDYLVEGGPLPGRWWSLTLYDADGYLVGPGPYSVESRGLGGMDGAMRWGINVGRQGTPGQWLPTSGLRQFELTLRLYLPSDGGRGDPARGGLPSITRAACR